MPLSSVDSVRYHFDNMMFDDPKRYGPFKIVQFGEIDVLPGYNCGEHIQPVDELTYIVSGSALFICNGVQYTVRAGDIVFNPKGSKHEIKAINNSSARYYYIGFEIENISGDTERTLKNFFKSKPPFVVSVDRSVMQAFRDIFLNSINPDEFSNALITDAIRKLLVGTYRAAFDRKIMSTHEQASDKNRTLSSICYYLDHNAEDIEVLKKLPEKFGYSYSYISSVFSKSMGISLKEYHLLSRHKRECELLNETKSVTEVADRMGYGSIHAFSHAFKAREGISPKAYINKERNEVE